MLPDLGTKSQIGRISGNGGALAIWAGCYADSSMLHFWPKAPSRANAFYRGLIPILGLDRNSREGNRAPGPALTAIWIVMVFMDPVRFCLGARSQPARCRERVPSGPMPCARLSEPLRALPQDAIALFASRLVHCSTVDA